MPGEWEDYKEHDGSIKKYKCPECRDWSGRMRRRKITEPSGDFHKEYKIVCTVCGFKTSAHYSKSLTESTWIGNGGT